LTPNAPEITRLRRNSLFQHCWKGLFALVACWAFGCASIQPPPGGPEDKTPAAVDTTTPYNRQLNVARNTKLYFRFDRPVDRASFIQALTITPYVNGVINYDWSGYDEVTVEFPEMLRDSTTYTVTLGRELKSRRGNNLTEPLRLTFSTGPFIDTGLLAGYVMNAISNYRVNANQIFVFAYDITVRNPDTLDLTRTPADLITQPADQGAWQFLSMKVGHRYRIYATTDAYRNHVYDLGTDGFGIPAGDALLDSAAKRDFFVRMSPPVDTVRPFVSDVIVQDSVHVVVRFSEAIDSNSVRPEFFSINDTRILAAFRSSPDKKPGQIDLLVDPPILPKSTHHLSITSDSIRDASGNAPQPTTALDVTAPETLPASQAPKLISIGLTDSVGNINPAARVPIKFSDAVSRSVESSVTVTDTGGIAVPIRFFWSDDATLFVSGRDSLVSNKMYVLKLRTNGIRSPSSSVALATLDTTFVRHFRIVDISAGGRLSGAITIADSFFVKNPASVLVVQLLANGSLVRETVLPHGETKFAFDEVPGDKYRVQAFLNRDGGRAYDAGSPYPWRFGVPSGDFPGDVEARPRWEIAKINFEVK
jgi:hypothetical protein